MALDVGQATLVATNLLTRRLEFESPKGKEKGGGTSKGWPMPLYEHFGSLYGRNTLDSLGKLSKQLDGAFSISKHNFIQIQ